MSENTNTNANANYLTMITGDLKRLWVGLDMNQKFAVAALIVVTVIAATFFIVKVTEPDWVVLYSDLTERDIISVTEGLKKAGKAYKISKDKKAVLVNSSDQDDLRMYVAENALIEDSSPGFELLDALQLGSTDFKNKMTKQRIFQGELTRSIEKINGIYKARVQIAEPERSVFADNDEVPSASVVLILEPGYRVKASQVAAIKNLVAYSVPRLTPEKVFITDQNGEILSDDSSKNSNDIESFRSNYEKQTAKKIKDVLEKIMGKDNISVQVSADLDFNSARSTIESYLPVTENGEGIVTSQQVERELYDNPQNRQQNQNLPDPNQVAQTPAELAAARMNINYTKEKSATNYGVTKEIKQVVYAPGSVKRITVAVAANKILTEAETQEIEELASAAAGLDMSRGDVINVTSLKFTSLESDKAEYEAMMRDADTKAIIDFIVTKVGPLGVVLFLGIMALYTFGSIFKRQPVAQTYLEGYDSEMPGSFQSASSPFLAGGGDPFADTFSEDYFAQFENQLSSSLEKKKNELTETVMADPSEAAQLLVSYIKE